MSGQHGDEGSGRGGEDSEASGVCREEVVRGERVGRRGLGGQRGMQGGGGLRGAGGDEAWALSLLLASLAFSSGLCIGIPETTGGGSLPVAVHSESPLVWPQT